MDFALSCLGSLEPSAKAQSYHSSVVRWRTRVLLGAAAFGFGFATAVAEPQKLSVEIVEQTLS